MDENTYPSCHDSGRGQCSDVGSQGRCRVPLIDLGSLLQNLGNLKVGRNLSTQAELWGEGGGIDKLKVPNGNPLAMFT